MGKNINRERAGVIADHGLQCEHFRPARRSAARELLKIGRPTDGPRRRDRQLARPGIGRRTRMPESELQRHLARRNREDEPPRRPRAPDRARQWWRDAGDENGENARMFRIVGMELRCAEEGDFARPVFVGHGHNEQM
jgi:hypothetical protein